VSVWEVTIKQAIGKLALPADLPERIRDSGFLHLSITLEHGIAAGRLPAIHRDPFDRMLIAQARLEDLTLVTRDAHIQKYDVSLLVA
jgi:PIN domain nuclease of toxin-antitoxin system